EPVLGFRAADAARVTLDGVRVPAAGSVPPDGAFAAALGFAHLVTAGLAVGIAQAAFEAALRYAQQRSAFGKPISQHQAIQLKLADMATSLTAVRLLVADAGDDPLRAAAAKLQASAMAVRVTLESMRTHGGYGYTAEFAVERHYRDAARLLHLPEPEARTRAETAAALVAQARP
ncbi:MAG: acyl-CoA dehydrogenase, partial [Candidatus Rokubacteria bacterium]|nr:acyl-CoA dehydrogenase [Candidatus Rokubacteria bacterium]